jgi:hypothetical protein
MKTNYCPQLVLSLALMCIYLCSPGCKTERPVGSQQETLTPTRLKACDYEANSFPASLTVAVPDNISNIFKSKCFLCHGGEKTEGKFDFKRMSYRPDEQSDWQPIDLDGATRIKFAILPIDGNAPKMPKQSGSILNPLTQQEANTIAKWTDYPFQP